MFEKFTERARKVMALANQEAQRCNHEYVDTDHMLIALLKEGSGVGATVLKNLGADLVRMRSELEKIDKPGPADMVTWGKLPQTPQAKKAIEYAVKEARSLNHNYVGTEHILLGLLHQPEKGKLSTANKILRSLKISPKEVRKEVMNILGAPIGKEKPVKCKIFRMVTGATRGFKSLTTVEKEIAEFLGDKRKISIPVVQSSAFNRNDGLIYTYITIFYEEK